MSKRKKKEPEEELISREEALQVVNEVIDLTAIRSRDMGRLNLVKLGISKLEKRENGKKKGNL